MNNSRLLSFFRARPAVLVAAGLILIFILGLVGALRPRRNASDTALYTNSAPGATTSVERDPVPPVKMVGKTPVRIGHTNKPFDGAHIHVIEKPDTNEPALGVYAPAGRFLNCILFNTIDSANTDTPVVALVTRDLWHNGRLVIPAGSEVHGKASVDRMRDRIVVSGSWTIVWQTGEELVVHGMALDREGDPEGGAWGITDGRSGLSGQVLRSDSLAEIKLFIATFVSGVASGLQETRSTVFGSQVASTTRNASLAGASQVMNTYAQQILETIKRDGIYVRVPAGKQMYLYVTHTIDLAQAKIGNLRASAIPAAFSTHPIPQTKP